MADPIPTSARATVATRQGGRCFRCGGRGSEWHHRRRRRVKAHRHCTCNGVLLCGTCHRWVHANPVSARDDGLIVSMGGATLPPWMAPARSWTGWVLLDCEGVMAPLA